MAITREQLIAHVEKNVLASVELLKALYQSTFHVINNKPHCTLTDQQYNTIIVLIRDNTLVFLNQLIHAGITSADQLCLIEFFNNTLHRLNLDFQNAAKKGISPNEMGVLLKDTAQDALTDFFSTQSKSLKVTMDQLTEALFKHLPKGSVIKHSTNESKHDAYRIEFANEELAKFFLEITGFGKKQQEQKSIFGSSSPLAKQTGKTIILSEHAMRSLYHLSIEEKYNIVHQTERLWDQQKNVQRHAKK